MMFRIWCSHVGDFIEVGLISFEPRFVIDWVTSRRPRHDWIIYDGSN